MESRALKPVIWVASSKSDLKKMPKDVVVDFGHALWLAQLGEMPSIALAMKGFSGASVLELKLAYKGNAFRTIYTVKFPKAIVVLHAFQKKSKKGISTPKQEIDLIKSRLKSAEELYERWQKEGN